MFFQSYNVKCTATFFFGSQCTYIINKMQTCNHISENLLSRSQRLLCDAASWYVISDCDTKIFMLLFLLQACVILKCNSLVSLPQHYRHAMLQNMLSGVQIDALTMLSLSWCQLHLFYSYLRPSIAASAGAMLVRLRVDDTSDQRYWHWDTWTLRHFGPSAEVSKRHFSMTLGPKCPDTSDARHFGTETLQTLGLDTCRSVPIIRPTA